MANTPPIKYSPQHPLNPESNPEQTSSIFPPVSQNALPKDIPSKSNEAAPPLNPPPSSTAPSTSSSSSPLTSLHHRLLGPSHTKAGLPSSSASTDLQTRISRTIYDASRGSKFFARETARDAELTHKIAALKYRHGELLAVPESARQARQAKAEKLIREIEGAEGLSTVVGWGGGGAHGRDQGAKVETDKEEDGNDDCGSKIIAHIDCDAFYAAVEQLSRPELRDVPFAVGGGVLTTCNYEARKFGVRSGMAGFVAKKLCPQLVVLPNDHKKYGEVARQVRAVLSEWPCPEEDDGGRDDGDGDGDGNGSKTAAWTGLEALSVDECAVDLTGCMLRGRGRGRSLEDTVAAMRADVKARTGISVSAGVGPNVRVAKIASNVNKPDGQFIIPGSRRAVREFIAALPVRKVNGVGRVLERELEALGVETVGDLWRVRGELAELLGEKSARFLFAVFLGLGRTRLVGKEERERGRKSIGAERTFRECEGGGKLRERLEDIAAELERDMLRVGVKGRTLVLKVKLHTFEVWTRQVAVPKAVGKRDEFVRWAEPMLGRLEREERSRGRELRIRLLGLRCTGLVSREMPKDFFGQAKTASGGELGGKGKSDVVVDGEGWEVWPEEEFEEEARREREAEREEMEKLSQEMEEEEQKLANRGEAHGANKTSRTKKPELWACPICQRPQPSNDASFNAHIDDCLSKRTIREVVQASTNSDPPSENKENSSSARRAGMSEGKRNGLGPGRRKRLRVEDKSQMSIKKAFFSGE